jgi:hypothetical protein
MTKTIPIQHSSFVAVVDDEDYELLIKYKWYLNTSSSGNKYPRTRIKNKNIRMHKLLLDAQLVDHVDGDGLNNQRANLRPSNKSLNAVNQRLRTHRSKTALFKGVYLYKPNKWRAQTTLQGKKIYLGTFDSAVDAARAYDAKIVEIFGEHALTNQMLNLYDDTNWQEMAP